MDKHDGQSPHKGIWIALCLLALSLVYIFQRVDYLGWMTAFLGIEHAPSSSIAFVVNKTLRLILNDFICMVMIYVLFREKKYLRVAFVVFCFEFFLVLPAYLILKLRLEGSSEISSPLLSQIHRLIVNPLLMLLLIVAFYYQRFMTTPNS